MANPWELYNEPFEIVDHLHERKHQHNSFLRSLTHRTPDPNTYPNHPEVDISDAITHYLVEVEVPGVKDPTLIQVYWSSSRSLAITGSTSRSPEVAEASTTSANIGEDMSHVANSPVETDFKALENEQDLKTSLAVGADVPPWLIVGERRIGSFRRDFEFPAGVEMGHITCKLEAGLLRVKLPKKHEFSFHGTAEIPIEV